MGTLSSPAPTHMLAPPPTHVTTTPDTEQAQLQ